MVLRMVEGSVRDAAHCHGIVLTDRFTRSIAKRAAGTLTAGWRDVLAAPMTPSARGSGLTLRRAEPDEHSDLMGNVRSRRSLRRKGVGDQGGGVSSLRRSPYFRIKKQLGIRAGQAKRANQPELYETIVEALRAIAKLEKMDVIQGP